ncbi:MAG: FAD:protein FMN transferase [Lachnospiraceae bacterium]|nr:FAD:protein FMN transferase [Lachnospiraceae bacterium]
MNERNRVQGDYFDTVNVIDACASSELLEEAMEQCRAYHRLLSKSEKASDIWRINHAEGRPVPVSEHTMRILKAGCEIYEASKGAFNMTVGAVTSLWNFKAEKPVLPAPEKIRRALTLMDAGKIRLEGDCVTIPAGMQVDVGGIAKGYIADRVAEFLRERGVTNGLLNFGGNVITIGTKPEGGPWMIGLQKPDGVTGRDFWAAFPSMDETAVTSGTYERGFTLDGVRYHHLLDPRTGWPVQNEVEMVTLIGKSSLLADGVSTACFVLGPEEGIPLAGRFDMKVIYRLKDGRVLLSREVELTLVKDS